MTGGTKITKLALASVVNTAVKNLKIRIKAKKLPMDRSIMAVEVNMFGV